MVRPTMVKESRTKGPTGAGLLSAAHELEQAQAFNQILSLEDAEAARAAAANQRLAQLALQAAAQGLPSHATSEFDVSDFNPFTEAQVTETREAVWRAWGECIRIDPNHHIDK